MFVVNELLAAITLLIITLYTVIRYSRRKQWVSDLPGKPPVPIFGNLLDFYGGSVKFLPTLMEYKQNYGNIYKIHDGPFSVVVVISDPKLMEHIFSSSKNINKAAQYSYFHNWLGTGLLTSTGLKWKKRRKMLTPSFHFSILETFVDIFDNVSDVFVRQLDKEVGKSNVNIAPLVSLCTLDIICEAVMGTSINAQEGGNSEYVAAVKTMCSIIADRIFSPLDPKLYPLTLNYYREKRALKVLHSHTDSVIEKRRESTISQTTSNDKSLGIKNRVAFLDLLLTYTMDGEPLSNSDIREEVDTFMFEGHDTTSSGISFTLYSLAMNPSVQERAYEELLGIFGNEKNVPASISRLSEMKYLEMVIKEALRLYPPVPFIGRQLSEDVNWDGVCYPKGLNLALLNFASQRDPEYFPNPEEFSPDRWIDNDIPNPYIYVPFSAGPRNCIGQKFAMLEMKSTISKVLRNFELLPASPEQHLKLASEIILVSKNGIRICLKRRK